jgi:hypothetical protein
MFWRYCKLITRSSTVIPECAVFSAQIRLSQWIRNRQPARQGRCCTRGCSRRGRSTARMQVAKHETHRLFSTSGCLATIIGVCDWGD